MSRDCCVALPRGAIGLSAFCDFGISWSYSLTIFHMEELSCVEENIRLFNINDNYPFSRK